MKSRKWARRRRNRPQFGIWRQAAKANPLADFQRLQEMMGRGIGLIEFGPGGTDGPPGWLFQAPSLSLPPEVLGPGDPVDAGSEAEERGRGPQNG